MQKRPLGRPKKIGAKTSGQLNNGECRYTFITTLDIVNKIKRESTKRKMSIKEYLSNLISNDKEEFTNMVNSTYESKLLEFKKRQRLNNS